MHQLTLVSNTESPKVFGHLYIAVFSNGTVKAGMAKSKPQDRVTSHAHSGRSFGISLETAFYASIYTDDTRQRERLMHEEIGALAVLTAGREWFKFECVDAALNFSSVYLYRVERMSFAERPSTEELANREKVHKNRFDRMFMAIHPASALPDPASDDWIGKIEATLSEYSLPVVSAMALRVINLEGRVSDGLENATLQTPILSQMIADHFEEFDRACHAYGKGDFSLTDRIDEALKNGHTLDKATSLQLIKAAAKYPAFFFEAMRLDLFGEVTA